MGSGQSAPELTVLHLISTGGFYGAERMLLDHVLHAPASARHRVLFIDAPDSVVQRFGRAGVDCSRVAGIGSLVRILRSEGGAAILNCHGYKALAWAVFCAPVQRRALVATLHGFTPVSRKQRFYGRLNLLLCRLPIVRRVACVSASIADIARSAGIPEDRIAVLPNAIAAVPAESGTVVEAGLEPALPGPLVGFVGRLRSEKGPDLFLECFEHIRREVPQARAVLLGDGPDRAKLETRLRSSGFGDTVRMAGYVDDIGPWLRRMDVLVLSSRTEGTPMILLEAMHTGTPVAAFSVGGVADLLDGGNCGLLARPDDVGGLARQALRLLRDPGLRTRLSRQARVRGTQQYGIDRSASTWNALYRTVAAS
ncbi:MAG: glycosyltransferase family 4 protein [Pseudomonadota bacterium]|nr:glycosyltransferase family 4 protein [Pseudomonadota bacterium]